MLRDTSGLDAHDVNHDSCGPTATAVAPVDQNVVTFRDGQSTLVPTMNGVNQSEKAISPRFDPGAVLNVAPRPVPLCCVKVPPVEERVKRLENQRLVSRLLVDIPGHLSAALGTAKSTADPMRDDRLELGRALFPDAVARLQNVQASIRKSFA